MLRRPPQHHPCAGPLFDRHWCIVSAKNHTFLTQRTTPQLSQVGTHISDSALQLSSVRQLHAADGADAPACLTLSFPGHQDLPISLCVDPVAIAQQSSSAAKGIHEATVWEWQGHVLDEGEEAAEWLSDALRQKVRFATVRSATQLQTLLFTYTRIECLFLLMWPVQVCVHRMLLPGPHTQQRCCQGPLMLPATSTHALRGEDDNARGRSVQCKPDLVLLVGL